MRTIKDLTASAKASTQYGYFQIDGTHARVKCPECDEQITVQHYAWLTSQQRVGVLREEVLAHLRADHREVAP
jgi:hypothetical protein